MILLGQLGDRDSALIRHSNHVVVDIRDVLDVADFVAVEFQPTVQRVLHDVDECMTKVAHVVGRHTADVHPRDTSLQRNEWLMRVR